MRSWRFLILLTCAAMACKEREPAPSRASEAPKDPPVSADHRPASSKGPTIDSDPVETETNGEESVQTDVPDVSEKNESPRDEKVSPAMRRSYLEKTAQTFKNGESVYDLYFKTDADPADSKGARLGEWWPVKNGINLITKETHPEIFSKIGQGTTYEQIFDDLGAVAMAPDGLTTGSASFQLQGNAVIDGMLYPSPDPYPNYGIVKLTNHKRAIEFTHKKEVLQKYKGPDDDAKMEAFFDEQVTQGNTAFFLPSIKREQNELRGADPKVHRALVHRTTRAGSQIGMVIFDQVQTYDATLEILKGLDRTDAAGVNISRTTHIFFTDGGPIWGQVARLTKDASNPTPTLHTLGTADYTKLTNFIVLY